jgi:WhiB family redox-sensing transcriptional regulator
LADVPRSYNLGDEVSDVGDLYDLLTRPAWWVSAACRKAPPGITWFPGSAQSGDPAKAICGTCPVVGECRTWSLEQGRRLDGIWGGLSKRDRAKLSGRLKSGP